MKKISLLIVAMVVAIIFAGCVGETPAVQESTWEITIGSKVFAIEDIREMDTVTINAMKKEETFSYTGVRLGVLLEAAEINDFVTLTLEAEDGYAWDISREEAMHENSILAFAVDGEDINEEKSAPIMFVSTATSTQAWVGKLATIKVGE